MVTVYDAHAGTMPGALGRHAGALLIAQQSFGQSSALRNSKRWQTDHGGEQAIQAEMLPHTLSGSGDTTLLFLHYFGGSQRTWSHVVGLLAPQYRCITVDLPGFGDAAGVTGYTVAEMREAVREVIVSLATSHVVVVGHSMGGKVAMALAADPPENLKQVILVAPSPLVPEPMTEEQRATMTVAKQSRTGAEQFVKNGALSLSEGDLQTGIEDVFRANDDAWKAWPQHGTREVWSNRITKFAVRTDLIVGEQDEAIPLTFQRQHTLPLVEASGGTLITIANAAHMLPYEAADDLASKIRRLVYLSVPCAMDSN